MDPYKALGISPSSGTDEIRAAYHALIKKWHPDRYLGTPDYEKAHEITSRANMAYELLRDRGFSAGGEGGPANGWQARYNAHRPAQEAYAARERAKRAGYDSAKGDTGGETRDDQGETDRFTHMAYDMAINGNTRAALRFLAMSKTKNAYWHYVRGIARHKDRDYDSAIGDFEQALAMCPGNSEYRQAWLRAVAARRQSRNIKIAAGAVAAAAVTAAAIIILK